MELICSTAEEITSDKVFYIAVPAGTYTFAVNVYCGTEVFHTSYTTAKTFTAGKIKYNATAKAFTDNGPAYVEGSYIGQGTKVDNIWWAPVNCGYDATNHKYGKLYQFGRKIGCGYRANDATSTYNDAGGIVQTSQEAVFADHVNNKLNDVDFNNYFYPNPNGYKDWYRNDFSSVPAENNLLKYWPMKSTDDGYLNNKIDNPCPYGWRVPTAQELGSLVANKSNWRSEGGIKGYSFSGSNTSSGAPSVFFPSAGERPYNGNGKCDLRGNSGYYWTSTVGANDAYALVFYNGGKGIYFSYLRANGFAVRCMKE